ncbi:hypothetical protein THAOC_22692, partial [Thalassiosira oceanica]
AMKKHHEHQPHPQLPLQYSNLHLTFRRYSGLADPKSNTFTAALDPFQVCTPAPSYLSTLPIPIDVFAEPINTLSRPGVWSTYPL